MCDDVSEALDRASVWCILPKRNMRTPPIIIGGEFRNNSPQVLFVAWPWLSSSESPAVLVSHDARAAMKYYRHRDLPVQVGAARTRRSQTMINPLDLLNKFISAIIAYGPKNKTKKARMARKAARRKKLAAIKRH